MYDIAMKITRETYFVYLNQLADRHVDFDKIGGHYLLKDSANHDDWTWMDKDYFDEHFEFVKEEDPTGFSWVTVKS